MTDPAFSVTLDYSLALYLSSPLISVGTTASRQLRALRGSEHLITGGTVVKRNRSLQALVTHAWKSPSAHGFHTGPLHCLTEVETTYMLDQKMIAVPKQPLTSYINQLHL